MKDKSLGMLDMLRHVPSWNAQGYRCLKGHGTFRKNEKFTLVGAKERADDGGRLRLDRSAGT